MKKIRKEYRDRESVAKTFSCLTIGILIGAIAQPLSGWLALGLVIVAFVIAITAVPDEEDKYEKEPQRGEERAFRGMDWAIKTGFNSRKEKSFMGISTINDYCVKIKGEDGEDFYNGHLTDWGDVESLIEEFDPEIIVIGAMPHLARARAFQSAHEQGKVWLAYYGDPKSFRKGETVRYEDDGCINQIRPFHLKVHEWGEFNPSAHADNFADLAIGRYGAERLRKEEVQHGTEK